jgi:putative phosphoesterase
MKIAIISDLHDNLSYLDIFLKYDKSDALLMCGDIANFETLTIISKSSYKKIYFVFGNADSFYPEEIPKNIINLGEAGIIELDPPTLKLRPANKIKIGLCHEPFKIPKLLEQKPYIIFHGHTHIPWIEQKGETMIVNPGTLGGWRNPSTFAVWDTSRGAPELVRTDEIYKNITTY